MLRGMGNINKRMHLEMKGSVNDLEAGMKLAVAYAKGESMEVTPVEHGVLVNTAFVDTDKDSVSVTGRIGFTAGYAPFVHEMPSTNNFTKSGTGPKFLEKPVESNISTIKRLIASKARR